MTKLLEGHNVKINSVVTKYKHTHTAFVENPLTSVDREAFVIMDAKKCKLEKTVKWVKHILSGIVDELNKEKNLMTGLAPATAIKRKVVKLKHKYPLKRYCQKMDYTATSINQGSSMVIKDKEQQT